MDDGVYDGLAKELAWLGGTTRKYFGHTNKEQRTKTPIQWAVEEGQFLKVQLPPSNKGPQDQPCDLIGSELVLSTRPDP